jgi:branched-chain amino acid transport system permease protein
MRKRQPPAWLSPAGKLIKAFAAVATIGVLLVMPKLTGDYVLGLVTLMAMYAIVLMAWNLVFGYAGVITFGQMAFFAIGAYAAALSNIHWGLSPWVDIWFGAIVAGLAGLLIGAPSLRLFGPYMVIFTLAFQLALAALLPALWVGTTGGTAGLFGIDALGFGSWDYLNVTWYLAAALAVITFIVIALVLRSPMGAALDALREGRVLAEARGIGLFQHRVILFTLSAFLTGLAGGIYAHSFQLITPSVLDISLLINLFAMLILGGLGTRLGPVIGAVVGVYLDDRLASTEQYSQLIWGAIILVVVMLAPGGIVTSLSRIARWLRDRVFSSAEVVTDVEEPVLTNGAPG